MKTSIFKFGKIFFTSALLLSCSLIITNCSKEDDTAPPEVLAPLQDPLPGYLTTTGFDQTSFNKINDIDYEIGYSFIPLVNGKITAIVAKLPDARLGTRITIWDKAAGTVIRTEAIDVPTAGVEVIKQITAVDLIKDKEYVISMNSNDYYLRRKTDQTSTTYPLTIGDIKITSFAVTEGLTQVIPSFPLYDRYAGDFSFKFQK